jgi:hypothetical protein
MKRVDHLMPAHLHLAHFALSLASRESSSATHMPLTNLRQRASKNRRSQLNLYTRLLGMSN